MKPKQVKTGRPPKSKKGNDPWTVRRAAEAMRKALEIMRQVDLCDDERPGFEADWKRVQDACASFGVWLCDCCDPDDPAEFLRRVADEFEGKLMHSPADDKIWQACCRAAPLTFPRFKEQFKKLSGNGSIPADSSLRRSMKRLGFRLSPSKKTGNQ